MSPVAIFLILKEEGFLFGGESSTLASLYLCVRRIAVAVELSFSSVDVSERQIRGIMIIIIKKNKGKCSGGVKPQSSRENVISQITETVSCEVSTFLVLSINFSTGKGGN